MYLFIPLVGRLLRVTQRIIVVVVMMVVRAVAAVVVVEVVDRFGFRLIVFFFRTRGVVRLQWVLVEHWLWISNMRLFRSPTTIQQSKHE